MPDHSENSIPTTARFVVETRLATDASGRLEGSYMSIYAQSKQPRGGREAVRAHPRLNKIQDLV
jgi:hypothetical protein